MTLSLVRPLSSQSNLPKKYLVDAHTPTERVPDYGLNRCQTGAITNLGEEPWNEEESGISKSILNYLDVGNVSAYHRMSPAPIDGCLLVDVPGRAPCKASCLDEGITPR